MRKLLIIIAALIMTLSFSACSSTVTTPAPDNGSAGVKEDLKDTGEDLKEDMKDTGKDIKDGADSAADNVKEKAHDMARDGKVK